MFYHRFHLILPLTDLYEELTKQLWGNTSAICIGNVLPVVHPQHVCGGVGIAAMVFTEHPVWPGAIGPRQKG